MGMIISTIQSLAVMGMLAGALLYNQPVEDDVYLGVGPRISVRHNEPSPAQAALEDVLTIDTYETKTEEHYEEHTRLVAGERFDVEKVFSKNDLHKESSEERADFVFNDLNNYHPRPTIRITKNDLYEILMAMEEQNKATALPALPEEITEASTLADGSNVRYVATSQGTPIVVQPVEAPKPSLPSISTVEYGNSNLNRSKAKPVDQRFSSADSQERTRLVHPTEVEWGFQGLKLSGQIGVTDGLIYNPEEQKISLFHNISGLNVEVGEVNIESAEFYIPISDASGMLVAEIRTRDGELKGVGTLEMKDLPFMEVNTDEITHLQILIKPKSEAFEGQIISAYSYKTNTIPVAGSESYLSPFNKYVVTTELGRYKDQDYEAGSRALLSTHKEGHWSSLHRVTTGHHQKVRMFAESDIKSIYQSLYGEISDEELKSFSIVKGKVIKGGQGFAGASVKVEDDFAIPVYYEYFLPRSDLVSTTESGEFIIFTKAEGARFVNIQAKGLSYPSQWVQLQPGTVTEVYFDLDYQKSKAIEVFDPILSEKLNGDLKYIGVDEIIPIDQGYANILTPNSFTELEVEVDMGEQYPLMRFMLNAQSERESFPMLSFDRIEYLVQKTISEESTCPVVGWFGAELEEVSVHVGERTLSENKIIYFNQQGEQVNSPEVGGGFLLDIDENHELIHLIAVPKTGHKLHSRYILRDSRVCQSVLF
ncbi:MAG: hypothetical protein R2827_03985 [Bdellovibrionales bacterium]